MRQGAPGQILPWAANWPEPALIKIYVETLCVGGGGGGISQILVNFVYCVFLFRPTNIRILINSGHETGFLSLLWTSYEITREKILSSSIV